VSTLVKVWITILMLALTAYGGYTGYKIYRVTSEESHQRVEPPKRTITWADVSDVTLIERSGEPLPLKQMKGKVWIVNFFFASCPGSCKIISTHLAQLQKDLGNRDVTLVSISVDPENDTPQVLTEYAKGFSADPKKWLFLTGDFEIIRGLCSDLFKIPVERKTHADYLVLVDQQGQIMGTFNSKEPAAMTDLIRKCDKLLSGSKDDEKSDDAKKPSDEPAGTKPAAEKPADNS